MAAALSIEDRLETDVRALIQGLKLASVTGATGDVGDNVLVQWQRERLGLPALPAAVVSCEGEVEGLTADLSSTEQRGTVYAVRVEVIDQGRPDLQAARSDYLAWRHAIIQALHEQSNVPAPPATEPTTAPPVLPSCPECMWVLARPAPSDPDKAAQAQAVAALVALCHCAEAR